MAWGRRASLVFARAVRPRRWRDSFFAQVAVRFRGPFSGPRFRTASGQFRVSFGRLPTCYGLAALWQRVRFSGPESGPISGTASGCREACSLLPRLAGPAVFQSLGRRALLAVPWPIAGDPSRGLLRETRARGSIRRLTATLVLFSARVRVFVWETAWPATQVRRRLGACGCRIGVLARAATRLTVWFSDASGLGVSEPRAGDVFRGSQSAIFRLPLRASRSMMRDRGAASAQQLR